MSPMRTIVDRYQVNKLGMNTQIANETINRENFFVKIFLWGRLTDENISVHYTKFPDLRYQHSKQRWMNREHSQIYGKNLRMSTYFV